MQKWPLRLGKFLFKFRSFTPLPLILLTFVFFRPVSPSPLWTVVGLAVAFLGEGVRACQRRLSPAAARRAARAILKAESLNTSGLYSLVRNPLYWGNGLIFAGLLTVYAQPLGAGRLHRLPFPAIPFHRPGRGILPARAPRRGV